MRVPREREAVSPTPIGLEKLLLVEGETPANFFDAITREIGLDLAIEIRSYNGTSQLGTYLKTLVLSAGFSALVKTLGIVRDAEGDSHGARQSINSAITNARIPKGVRVEVAILPDSGTPGMIETLFLRSVQTSPVFECIDDFLKCVSSRNVILPSGPVLDKHIMQIYLATLPKPQMMPGTASHRGAWPFDHAAFNEIKDFLRGL